MKSVPTPSVPDLARAEGESVDQLISWFVDYYDRPSVPWNYVTSTRTIKEAYRGFNNMHQLLAACQREKNAVGRKSNEEVVECGAPLAFDRRTQVFDLPSQKFQFGQKFFSSYRVPFFFLEFGIVKLYYLQPRRTSSLTWDQLGMIATIHKKFLLDYEFFGQKSDVEYVDLSAHPKAKDRDIQLYTLADFSLWSDEKLDDRLTLIAEALGYIDEHNLVKRKHHSVTRETPDLPLF